MGKNRLAKVQPPKRDAATINTLTHTHIKHLKSCVFTKINQYLQIVMGKPIFNILFQGIVHPKMKTLMSFIYGTQDIFDKI